ncbi:MAG: hypothetical protein ACOVOV_05850, partial [Dolichospermum sp.]
KSHHLFFLLVIILKFKSNEVRKNSYLKNSSATAIFGSLTVKKREVIHHDDLSFSSLKKNYSFIKRMV